MKLHVAVLSLIALLLPLSAHAQSQEQTSEAVMARIMIDALAPTGYGDWAYSWDAVSARISRHMRWHLPEPDPRDRPRDAEVRRTGWIDAGIYDVGVSALGGDARVRVLTFRVNRIETGDVFLDALRAAGAELTPQSVTSAASRYTLAAPERDTAMLERISTCTSPRSAAMQRCWFDYTLTLPSRPTAQN